MTVHKWFVGFFLAIIMVTALGINAMLFSSRSFQFHLAQVAPRTNGVLDVRQLDDIDRQIAQIEQESAGPRGESARIEQQLALLNADIQSQQQTISQTIADLAQGVSSLEERLGRSAGVEPAASLDSAQLEARATSLISTPGLPASQSQEASTIRQTAERLGELEENVAGKETERRTLMVQQRLVGGQVVESDNRIRALKQLIVENDADYDRVRSEANALRVTSFLGIGTTLVSAHPTFISTVLVLLMGALGAILYLFPAYMSRPEPVNFAEIIMRMIFGMVTALAFYIVANATLAGLSFVPNQASTASNAAMLNPFTVGLVGIVAGIMADDIAKWIQSRGSAILSGQGGAATQVTTTRTTTTATSASADDDGGFSGVNPHGGPPPE
ncbi:MAG: hypothetical protein AB7O04_00570 [Hyphomonadaceae bacterium]